MLKFKLLGALLVGVMMYSGIAAAAGGQLQQLKQQCETQCQTQGKKCIVNRTTSGSTKTQGSSGSGSISWSCQ